MTYYEINVTGQHMTVVNTSKSARFVEGSQSFVHFRFNFDESWDGLTVFAQFIQNGTGYNVYLDENNSVDLPPEIENGQCLLVLYGSGGSVIGTTNALVFTIDEYKLIADGESVEITESLYNQMIDFVTARIPAASGEDGTYTYKATISGGTVTYGWVKDEEVEEQEPQE